MVGADTLGRLEPVAGRLREDMALVGNAGQNAVEGAQAIGGDDDATSIGKVVIVTDLAAVMVGKFRDEGFGQDAHGTTFWRVSLCLRYRMFSRIRTRMVETRMRWGSHMPFRLSFGFGLCLDLNLVFDFSGLFESLRFI